MDKIKVCKNGCNKPVRRIGLCSTCYNKYLKEKKKSENRICSIEGCDSIEFSSGYCSKHYKQIYRNGTTSKRTKFDNNEYIIHEDYAEIILGNNKGEEVARAIVDIEDIEKAKMYKWHLDVNYATYKNKHNRIHLHRLIMNVENNKYSYDTIVDHIDGNSLNNRKNNLRIVSATENSINKKKQRNNTSGTVGVSWNKDYKKWESYIAIHNKRYRLGYFNEKDEAIRVREIAELEYHNEYSRNYNNLIEKYKINEAI